jgi:L-aspartate oxidase
VGQLYRYTSNPIESDGTGLALAAQAGAELSDLEFVQFHPTALAPQQDQTGNQLPLVTEALRGAGALLLSDGAGRFMPAIHTQAELAPRDVVARAVWDQLARGYRVYLDARSLGDSLRTRFPGFVQACASRGMDPRAQPIPVVPAAHYHMGGIKVDLHSMSRVPGLYAVGEVACTGVHGANRLASNSLLEAIAFGRALGQRLGQRGVFEPVKATNPIEGHSTRPVSANDEMVLAKLRQLMWNDVGIVRSYDGLQFAHQQIQVLERRCLSGSPVLRQLLLARLITEACMRRKDSIGAHHVDARPGVTSGVQAVA